MTMVYCGIDIGTTNTKSVILSEKGRFLDQIAIESANQATPKWHLADGWYRDFCEVLDYFAAKGEMALRQIMARERSHACGLNFLALCNDPRIADGLHVAACNLMHQGAGYAAEGDWVTAIWVRALQQGYGTASFSEMFSVDYAGNRLVLKHWGEGNIVMAREKPKMCLSEFNDIHPAQFAIVDFEFQPGRAILANLNSSVDGKGQLISIAGQITGDHLPKTNGPRAVFQPDAKDVRELLTTYACNGGSHHLALIPSDRTEVIQKIGVLRGWTYLGL